MASNRDQQCSAKWGESEFCERSDIVDRKTGLCGGHYQQHIRRGGPLRAIRFYRPVSLSGAELAGWFISEATIIGDNGCRNWLYARSGPNGYPVASVTLSQGNPIRVGVHRFIAQYYLNDGVDLSTYEVVHHKCSNRICINPDHLQIVSSSENNAEMLERKVLQRKIKDLEEEVEELKNVIKSRSNMTKLDADGKPIFREDGKIMKSDLYEPPNLEEIVRAV